MKPERMGSEPESFFFLLFLVTMLGTVISGIYWGIREANDRATNPVVINVTPLEDMAEAMILTATQFVGDKDFVLPLDDEKIAPLVEARIAALRKVGAIRKGTLEHDDSKKSVQSNT